METFEHISWMLPFADLYFSNCHLNCSIRVNIACMKVGSSDKYNECKNKIEQYNEDVAPLISYDFHHADPW